MSTLTQVTDLKYGDVITLGSDPVTVRTAQPYGDRETALTFEHGSHIILANTNWFPVL